MALLQPNMLWGILAVAVPVAIHFWYQKRGKTIEWAAMRWLGEQTTLQHRGLRLNEVWLMILRCILVILLALILSQPVVEWFRNAGKPEVVHLVQADRLVTDTYRFELEKALRDGEPVYRLGAAPEKFEDINETAEVASLPPYLQQNINALAAGNAKDFRLYFRNDGSLNARVYVPGAYQLFAASDPSGGKPVDILKDKGAYKRAIKILLDYRDSESRQTVQAALSALAEVYGFSFEITNKRAPESRYDLVFSDELWTDFQPGTTYVISGHAPRWSVPAQVVQLRDTLRTAASELVESGRLPEWVGEQVVRHLGLKPDHGPLSRSQLNALFEKIPASRAQEYAALRPWLLLVLVMLMVAERWWALRKKGRSNG